MQNNCMHTHVHSHTQKNTIILYYINIIYYIYIFKDCVLFLKQIFKKDDNRLDKKKINNNKIFHFT